MEALDIALRFLGAVGFAGIAVTILGKKITPRRSPAEQRDARVAELERGREADRKDLVDCKHDMRLLIDYVHELREHIALEKAPPPPDFPEGMRL